MSPPLPEPTAAEDSRAEPFLAHLDHVRSVVVGTASGLPATLERELLDGAVGA